MGLVGPEVGLIPMARAIVIKLFGNMSEDAIADMARDVGVNTVREISLFMEHKTDLESFLEWFETRMKTSFVEISHRKARVSF